MLKFIFNLSKLILYSLYSKKKYDYTKKINLRDIKIIRKYVNDCGCICVKCVQWLLPILEKENIDKDIINILNNVYENNDIHDIKYTEYLYNKHFKKELLKDYKIINVIGSGSIGQVYKIQSLKTQKYFVMKVKHPFIENQIYLFKNIFKFIYKIKCFDKLFYNYFPFNLVKFLEDFYKQTDFINECNNLLEFYHIYSDNDYIIIPNLNKVSKDIIIMEYVDGECLDCTNLSEYKKSKVIYLLYLFVRNNLLILNNNHGDLHKYNWKVSNDQLNNINKIIIYDFGYCFKLNNEEYENILILCDLISSYDENKEEKFNDFIKFLFNTDKNIDVEYTNRITEPEVLLEQILQISNKRKIIIHRYKVLNTLLLMCLVDNYFQKYNINNNNNMDKIKKNILDAYSFCETYKIFPELSKHLLKEYNVGYDKLEIISFSDKIKSLIK